MRSTTPTPIKRSQKEWCSQNWRNDAVNHSVSHFQRTLHTPLLSHRVTSKCINIEVTNEFVSIRCIHFRNQTTDWEIVSHLCRANYSVSFIKCNVAECHHSISWHHRHRQAYQFSGTWIPFVAYHVWVGVCGMLWKCHRKRRQICERLRHAYSFDRWFQLIICHKRKRSILNFPRIQMWRRRMRKRAKIKFYETNNAITNETKDRRWERGERREEV